jgi:hypothetical protein
MCGAQAIHFTFTSLTLASTCVAARRFDSIKSRGAGVIQMNSNGEKHMNVTKVLGLAAVGALLILAAPTERAQAMSLSNPGAAAVVQDDSKAMTTQVGWHHHHHHMWRRHR